MAIAIGGEFRYLFVELAQIGTNVAQIFIVEFLRNTRPAINTQTQPARLKHSQSTGLQFVNNIFRTYPFKAISETTFPRDELHWAGQRL